jgi:hypothetical protein
MSNYLAKLENCRGALGGDNTESDDVLLQMLGAASSLAERLVGLEDGALRRQTGIVEYPTGDTSASGGEYARTMRLAVRPLESIAQIKQLFMPGRAADFAAVNALVNGTDYVIGSPQFGRVDRVGASWYLGARCLRVTYTAGFVDPTVAAEVADWDLATNYDLGDLVRQGGKVYCALADNLSAVDNTPGPQSDYGDDVWARVWEVPQDLQFAVGQQVIRMFQTWEHAGRQEITTVGGGASISLAETKPHPSLVEATRRLRVLL